MDLVLREHNVDVCLCMLVCVGGYPIKRKAVYLGWTQHIDGYSQFAFARLPDIEILWYSDRVEIQPTVF